MLRLEIVLVEAGEILLRLLVSQTVACAVGARLQQLCNVVRLKLRAEEGELS